MCVVSSTLLLSEIIMQFVYGLISELQIRTVLWSVPGLSCTYLFCILVSSHVPSDKSFCAGKMTRQIPDKHETIGPCSVIFSI